MRQFFAMNPSWPPPGSPTVPPGAQLPSRRRPVIVALLAGTVGGAAAAAVITTQIATRHADSGGQPPAAVTVTAAPSAPTPALQLPAAQADRATCNAWLAAGKHVDAAGHELSVIPKGITIADQPVRDNADWTAAVHTAAKEWGLAGDTLAAGIAPGTTPILYQSATAAAAALHALSTADETLDAAGGNTFQMWHESADTVNVLCGRLAPR